MSYSECTSDTFECGLCGLRMSDIDTYVGHMTTTEKCLLMLYPSARIENLLVPRFQMPKFWLEHECVDQKPIKLRLKKEFHEYEACATGMNDAAEMTDSSQFGIQAVEVETGGMPRWRCLKCSLTFSRYAAVVNHDRLLHSVIKDMIDEQLETESVNMMKVGKGEVDSRLPVKIIMAVKSGLEEMDTDAEMGKWKSSVTCTDCHHMFKSEKILSVHQSAVHSDERHFKCHFMGCFHSFKYKGSLKKHLRRHTGERPFICGVCGHQFRESGALTRHLKARVPCNENSIASSANYGITKPFTLKPLAEKNEILKNFKQELTEDVNCIADSTPLQQQNALHQSGAKVKLETEIYKVVPSKVIKIKCKTEKVVLCDPVLADEEIDRDQLAEDGNSEEIELKCALSSDNIQLTLICPLCCKVYKRKEIWKGHVRSHLGDLGNECSKCNRSFTNDHDLLQHLSLHSSVRPFNCKICGKSFKLAGHARGHLRSHSGRKEVLCSVCGKMFKTVSSRNVHAQTHMSEHAFQCDTCDKSFSTKASLIRHVRIHTGETPFQCPCCLRRFKEHGTLSRHLKSAGSCNKQTIAKNHLEELGIELNLNEDLDTEEILPSFYSDQDTESFMSS